MTKKNTGKNTQCNTTQSQRKAKESLELQNLLPFHQMSGAAFGAESHASVDKISDFNFIAPVLESSRTSSRGQF